MTTPLEMLRELGPGSPPSPQTKQRVYDGLLTALGTAAMSATQQPLVNGQAATTGALSSIASSKAALIGAGLWLFGGATGAVVYGALRPAEVRVIYVDRPAAMASVAPPSNELPLAAPVAPASAALSPSAARSGSRRAPPERDVSAGAIRGSSDLARERAVLDVARANAAKGEPEHVLEEVERHRQQFPYGRLAEEREALAIRALLSLGRKTEAQARAQAFRAAYPNSFLAPMLDAAASGS